MINEILYRLGLAGSILCCKLYQLLGNLLNKGNNNQGKTLTASGELADDFVFHLVRKKMSNLVIPSTTQSECLEFS